MKQKRILVLALLFTLIFGVRVFATEKNNTSVIFMGQIMNVEKSDNNDALKVTIANINIWNNNRSWCWNGLRMYNK